MAVRNAKRSERTGRALYTGPESEIQSRIDEREEAVAHLLRTRFKQQIRQTEKYRAAIEAVNDIGQIPDCLSPRLRARMRYDLKLFLDTCFPKVFHMEWGQDQLELVTQLQDKILHGGLKSVAMPRGSGKTSICHGAVCWVIAYGHRRFAYFIRDDQNSAEQSLEIIRSEWENNDILYYLFPEIAFPIRAAGTSFHKVRNQTYMGQTTHMVWKKAEARFPALHDYHYNEYDVNQAGVVIRTAGITGSIRGAVYSHPLTGEALRPDFILLDDVQTDRAAVSPTTVEKLIDVIDGAVKGLSPPGKLIAGCMPCTVIRPDDVSDTYLDRTKKPIWHGDRYRMVISWPDGITDDEITETTEASRRWLEYTRLRIESLQKHGDISLATAYYAEHREVMDKGFTVSWPPRYVKDKAAKGNIEISAQQHAMNLRLENLFTFCAEFLNSPRVVRALSGNLPTIATLAERQLPSTRRYLPYYCNRLVGMIDIQNEMLAYTVMGLDQDYTGIITDYGTYPDFTGLNRGVSIRKQANTLRHMSYYYWHDNKDKYEELGHYQTIGRLQKGRNPSAPFEDKIYHALWKLCDQLLKNTAYFLDTPAASTPEFQPDSPAFQHETLDHEEGPGGIMADTPVLPFDYLAIDCKWGEAADIVKRFIADYGDSRLVPYEGVYIGATSRQMNEYARGKGSVFEDEKHRGLNISRWVAKFDPATRYRRLLSDVNRWKTFLMNRLTSPRGSVGAICLYKAPPEEHEWFCSQLCKSEYPEPVTAKGRTLFEWKEAGKIDNEFLDCSAGCMALASLAGCRLRTDIGTAEAEPDASASAVPPVARTKPISSPRKDNRPQHRVTQRKKQKASEIIAAKRRARQRGTLSPR